MEAIYKVEGATIQTSAFAGGPWDPGLQHGAAPSSLICWAVERLPSPAPMRVARLTVDLMRPVPVAPLTVETEILREGRKIQLVAVRLLADGKEVVRATALRIRKQDEVLPVDRPFPPLDLPPPEDGADADGRRHVVDAVPVGPRDEERQGRVQHSRPCRRSGIAPRGRSSTARRVVAADARRHRRGLLQRHLGIPVLQALDLHQCRPDAQPGARAGRRMDPARCRDMGRPRLRSASRPRGSPTATATSAAPCRACCSRSAPSRASRSCPGARPPGSRPWPSDRRGCGRTP